MDEFLLASVEQPEPGSALGLSKALQRQPSRSQSERSRTGRAISATQAAILGLVAHRLQPVAELQEGHQVLVAGFN
jgi:enoyl-CoA hydratase/carnithine racemase